MKKTFLFGLIAAALGFAACSSEDDAILSQKPQKGMMTLNATVQQSVDTRATLDVDASPWAFDFANGDELKVTNSELTSGTYYTFTKGATDFASTTATPTSSPATWYAYFPSNTVTLTGQSGSSDDVANKYALVGTATSTTGSEGLNITMSAQVAILKIVNAGGSIDLNVKNSASTWVTGLEANNESFTVTTSTTKASLLSKTTAGTYYVAVPAGIALEVKDGDTRIKSTATGLNAGKYYKIVVGSAPWTTALSLGKSDATSISIETGVSTKPTSGTEELNADGTLWAVLDGTTLKIQTSAPKITGRNSFVSGSTTTGLFEGYTKVNAISGLDKIEMNQVTNMSRMFYNCNALASLDLSSFNTSKVTDMSLMFCLCNALTSLDLSSFNTSEVTNMQSMFSNCKALESLTLTPSLFNTAKVTDMSSMFALCYVLPSLDLSWFNTEKVTTMERMFSTCRALTTLSLASFNTANVTNMAYMFNQCWALTALDVSSFNTEKVTTMRWMFLQCKSLTSLDLSNFKTSTVENMSSMVGACYKLESLKLSNEFKFTSVTDKSQMFGGCGMELPTGSYCVISNVDDSVIKDACKECNTTNTKFNTQWNKSDTHVKFDGE